MAKRPRKSAAGGSATTEGLIYQAAVAVWAALELMLVQRSASEIDIEPPSHEDAEAEIQPDEANGAASRADLPEHRLVIQVKLRNSGPWSVEDLDRLMTRGTRRVPAATRLANDPRVRFLLVTSADVSAGAMQDLKVSEFGEFPPEAPSAATFAAFADKNGSRIAVLNAATVWVVEQKIKNLLEDVFKIPHDQVTACRKALEDEALLRSRAGANSLWTRADLHRVLKAHSAYFTIGPDLDDFVEPDNWATLVDQAKKGAVVITGQSGSGKTLSALKLCEELRLANSGLKVVDVRQGPGQVNREINNRPILFYLEDPWGRYQRTPDALPWNDELLRMLPKARGDLFFVITSRSDVLGEFGEMRTRLGPWTVALNAEEYGSAARDRLFETRLGRLSPPIQLLALRVRKEALRTLETPLEIDRYFVHLAQGPLKDETERAFLSRALHAAHHTTFEDEVANTVMARDDIGWGALLWAMLKAAPVLERSVLTKVRRPVQAAVPRLQGKSLENLVNLLVVGRSLKQPHTALAYAHPRVEAGLAQAMDADPEFSGDVLEATLDALIGLDREASAVWGRRAAAAIMMAGVKERESNPGAPSRVVASAAAQAAVDSYLEAALVSDSDAAFNETLRLAAGAGSGASALCELARWLLARERVHEGWWVPRWRMQPRDDAWFDWINADPRRASVLDRFVRLTLTVENQEYPTSLMTHLDRFGFDLTAAFTAAALQVVNSGYDGRAEVVIAGAMRDIAAAEPVAVAAAAVIADLQKDSGRSDREADLPLTNGDYDDEYTEHLLTGHDDEGYVAGAILDIYVPGLRGAQGWRALDASPAAGPGLGRWLLAAEKTSPRRLSTAELLGLQRRAAGGREEEDFARLALRVWRPALIEPFVRRIRDDDGKAAAWAAMVVALATHASGDLLRVHADWIAGGELAQGLRLHRAVMRGMPVGPGRNLVLRRLRQDAPPAMAALSRALEAPSAATPPDALTLLTTLSSHDLAFDAELARLGVAKGVLADAAIDACLEHWRAWRTEPAVAAIEAAVALQAWPLIDRTRAHPLAVVRRVAMAAWADHSTAGGEAVLDQLRTEKSSKVIRHLIGRLTARSTLDHLDHFLALAANTWSEHSTPSGEPSSYPFARKAAEALLDVEDLPDARLADIFRVGAETEDPNVRRLLLLAIAANGGPSGRTRMIAFALNTKARTPMRRGVAEALRIASDYLKPADLKGLTPDVILDAPPSLAVEFVRLQAAVQTTAALVPLARRLAASSSRRVLVLLLNTGRLKDLGEQLVASLPARHKALTLVRHPKARSRLPRSAVDDLGDVRLVERVRSILSDRFEQAGSGATKPKARKRGRRGKARRAA